MKELILQYAEYERNVLNHSVWKLRYYFLRRLDLYLRDVKWGGYQVEDIQLIDVLNYITKYRLSKIENGPNIGKYPTNNSQYNIVISIRMFFKYLALIGKRLNFNWEQIPIIKLEEKVRQPMSREDYELLLQATILYNDSDRQDIILRDQLLFEIPWETWLRRNEIVRCKFEDFHNSNRQFKVLVKWGRYENVFFSKRLQQKVFRYEELVRKKYRWHEDIEYLFFYMGQKDKWKKLSWKVAWIIVSNYVKKLKAAWKIPADKKLSLHMERHSFAMKCVYSGLSQQATTQLMRHKDPKITMYYYHMNDEWLLNQYDLIKY